MNQFRLQFVCSHGHPNIVIGGLDEIIAYAAIQLASGHAKSLIIEDNASAIEGALDEMEPVVEAAANLSQLLKGYKDEL